MKNITVTVPDEVYRKARVLAAQRDTSVSAIVKEYLIALGQEETDFDRRKRQQAETFQSIEKFTAGDRLSRRDAHEI